jgi:hypothetical protein
MTTLPRPSVHRCEFCVTLNQVGGRRDARLVRLSPPNVRPITRQPFRMQEAAAAGTSTAEAAGTHRNCFLYIKLMLTIPF